MGLSSNFDDIFSKVVAPEFADKVGTPEYDLFQTEALCEVSESKFGCRYDRAVALIMAHLMAMADRSKNGGGNSNTGQVKRTKVGQLEREFDTGSGSGENSNGSYDLTTYGKEYLRLRKQIIKSPIFVSC